MENEDHLRSMTKSLIWRLMGVIILTIIAFIFTRSWIATTLITTCHHLAFIFIYYGHERAWLRVKNPWVLRRKWWLRPVTYEIILGHVVLGIISLIFTGSWLKMTLISVVYIENKLWIYIVYDWIWNKISWRRK